MPKRKSVQKYPCDEVQGEGSYVEITAVKVSEIKAIRKASQDPDFDEFEGGLVLLRKHIKSWNWVGDDDKPLPFPSNDPNVINELTEEESRFLANLLLGDTKN